MTSTRYAVVAAPFAIDNLNATVYEDNAKAMFDFLQRQSRGVECMVIAGFGSDDPQITMQTVSPLTADLRAIEAWRVNRLLAQTRQARLDAEVEGLPVCLRCDARVWSRQSVCEDCAAAEGVARRAVSA